MESQTTNILQKRRNVAAFAIGRTRKGRKGGPFPAAAAALSPTSHVVSQQAPVVVAQPTPKMDSAAPAEKSFGSDQRKTFSYRANSSIFIRKVYYITREEGNNHDIYLIFLLRK